jgi:FKBP-type peptidyl-prolyl cis-trans isomerase
MTRNQTIGVFAGLALLGYLFFSGPLLDLFNGDNINDNQRTQMQAPETGFVVEEVAFGQGVTAQPGDTLTVHYVGRLTSGQIFDTSRDSNTPFTFTLGAGNVIRGWDEGLVGMKVGSTRRLIIAPDFAYGERGIGPIPPNATLIFEVELLNVEKAAN